MANKYTVEIAKDRPVTFRELTVPEFEACMRMKRDGGGTGEQWELVQEGIRRSVVEDRGKPVTYTDLDGDLLGQRFTTRELLVLRGAWMKVHLPDDEDQKRMGEIRAVAT